MADPRKLKRMGVFYAHAANESPIKIEHERKALSDFLTKRFHEKIGAHMSPNVTVTSEGQSTSIPSRATGRDGSSP